MTQNEYLEILFNDCGFNRVQRNVWLKAEFGYSIVDLDNLSKFDKSRAIDRLKEIKRLKKEQENDAKQRFQREMDS